MISRIRKAGTALERAELALETASKHRRDAANRSPLKNRMGELDEAARHPRTDRAYGRSAPAEEIVAPRGSQLPRSGPIGRSVGAMSRAEQLARKLKLNINSPTTRQVLNSLDDKVSSFVSQFRKGSILRELPSEVLEMTLEEALQHSSKVRKLLIDGRFVK